MTRSKASIVGAVLLLLVLAACFLASPPSANATALGTVLFSDGFESGMGQWAGVYSLDWRAD